MEDRRRDEAITFLLRLGRALHEHGAPAHRLEEAMATLAPLLGLEGHFLSTPTSLSAAFGEPPDQRTYLLRVRPGRIQLGRLTELDGLQAEVMAGRLAPAEATVRLAEIVASPPRYGLALTLACAAVASASAARFFGGGWREIAVAGAIALATGAIAPLTARVRVAERLYEPLAALLAAVVAGAAASTLGPMSPFIASVAGIVALLPGLSLTTALTELATENLVSGTARLAGVTLSFIGVGAGLAAGTGLCARFLHTPQSLASLALPAWTEIVALVLAPLALTVLFRARLRDAGWILAAAVLSFFAAREAAARFGPEVGTFLAAVVLGVAGNAWGRRLNRPSAVILTPGILMIVPGSIGIRSVSSLIQHDVVAGAAFGITLALAGIALAAGLLVANAVVSPRRSL